MSTSGSGERILILSDRISTSSPAGADQETPPVGKILLFLDDSLDLFSKDELGVVKPLNGGVLSDASWEAISPATSPTPTGEVTHRGRAAVGLLVAGPMLTGIQFQVSGNEAIAGSLYLESTIVAEADLSGYSQIFRKLEDAGLYAKPVGLPERRIDAPGLIRKTIPADETIIAPDGSQYLVFGTFTLGLGATLSLVGDADLVVL